MVLESGMPATVFTGSQEEGDCMAAVMIGVDPHCLAYGGGDQRGGGAAG